MNNEKLIELRQAKGWTQEELAKASGVSRTHIAMFERGLRDPSLAQLALLAEVLGCEKRDLV